MSIAHPDTIEYASRRAQARLALAGRDGTSAAVHAEAAIRLAASAADTPDVDRQIVLVGLVFEMDPWLADSALALHRANLDVPAEAA